MSDIGFIEMTEARFYALPKKVQEALRMYGEERPQGWGKPSRIYLPHYRLQELERMMAEATAEETRQAVERTAS